MFWTDLLRSLMRSGLRGVKLLISDVYEGSPGQRNRGASLMARVAEQLHERFPEIAQLMAVCEDEVLAHMGFPKAHRQQIHSTNPLERRPTSPRN
ncbi:hypothetical protein A5892_15640 [Halotalea alkalilenta]|uniref:Mutator family transposase n=1 Tax=Halotalea alkalilenta TaxID=376489 RepID=A0A172YHJ6_9GAMM|nr:hypothetical protein A5892_15640 [Halotalea alkalilenta]